MSDEQIKEVAEAPAKEVEVKAEKPKKPAPAPKAPEKEQIETDVRTKLSRKTEEENPFVPSSPAKLEADVKRVAEEKGFELNRGTSIGARLIAKAQQNKG